MVLFCETDVTVYDIGGAWSSSAPSHIEIGRTIHSNQSNRMSWHAWCALGMAANLWHFANAEAWLPLDTATAAFRTHTHSR